MGHPPTFPVHGPGPAGRLRIWGLGALLLLGCAPPVLQVAGAKDTPDFLAFLQDGRTTREEAILRLGTPNARLEGERILTYAYATSPHGGIWSRRGRDRGGKGEGVPWDYRGPVHSLVLVFGADGVLTRHSLVVSR